MSRVGHIGSGAAAVAEGTETASDLGLTHPGDAAPITLLVDSAPFWQALQADPAGAREYAYLQTYSFEGDWVGTALTEKLLAAKVGDRRLLIDSYTRANQSDRWIPAPGYLFDRELREEVRNARRLIAALRSDGAGVRFGRPFGFIGHRILRRDHKKLMLFDDRVAYIGGSTSRNTISNGMTS